MAVTAEAVIPLLRDVRDAEEAVAGQLRAIWPPNPRGTTGFSILRLS